MLPGVYAAASGMITQRERLDVISNNVANIGTTAFKRSEPVSQGFYQVFAEQIGRFPPQRGSTEIPGGGAVLDTAAKDFSPGSVVETGNPLDVAIDGPGFFVVRTPVGERYTRAGNFSLSSDGQLVTQTGEAVLGEQGPILVQGESLSISSTGQVMLDGEPVDRIRVVDFPLPHRLRRYGRNLYGADEETTRMRVSLAEPNLRAGALELSNVNAITEITNLMDAARTYEAQQRIIVAFNESLDAAVNDIARS